MRLKAAVLAAAALTLVSCGGAEDAAEKASTAAPVGTKAPSEPAPATTTQEAVAEPRVLEIPTIDVTADLVRLGLNDDGSMETPDYGQNLAGWYTEGPKPGEVGPAVIAAHVDNPSGNPDTFGRLHELEPGDDIIVTDDAGNEYEWTVERLQRSNKAELPYSEIWGDVDTAALRLITCAGAYVDGSYVENLIVYAQEG